MVKYVVQTELIEIRIYFLLFFIIDVFIIINLNELLKVNIIIVLLIIYVHDNQIRTRTDKDIQSVIFKGVHKVK